MKNSGKFKSDYGINNNLERNKKYYTKKMKEQREYEVNRRNIAITEKSRALEKLKGHTYPLTPEYYKKTADEYQDIRNNSEKNIRDIDIKAIARKQHDKLNKLKEKENAYKVIDDTYNERLGWSYLTEDDKNWLKTQGHDKILNEKLNDFKLSKDVEDTQRRLNDISSNYFYDEVGVYNENIDSIATKWAYDNARRLHYANKGQKDVNYELYKRAKENPESIDPMTENSTDWEALEKKYGKKYENERMEYESRVYGVNVKEADAELKRVFPGMKYSDETKLSENYKNYSDKQLQHEINKQNSRISHYEVLPGTKEYDEANKKVDDMVSEQKRRIENQNEKAVRDKKIKEIVARQRKQMQELKDKELKINNNDGELTGYTDKHRIEYHHSGDTGLMAKVFSTDGSGRFSGHQFSVPKEYQGDKLQSYSMKEIQRLERDKNAYNQRQENGLSRIDSSEYYKKDWGEDVYKFSEGTAWKGSKSESGSVNDVAKNVTDQMKKAYPGVKIGRKTSHYSGGSSVDFNIYESDKPIVKSFGDYSEDDFQKMYNSGYNRNWFKTIDEYKEHFKKDLESGKLQVNTYYIDDDDRLTDYGKQVIKDLKKVTDAYNYDESDGMTDYFNRRFYSDISIGTSKKPYSVKQAVAKQFKKKK